MRKLVFILAAATVMVVWLSSRNQHVETEKQVASAPKSCWVYFEETDNFTGIKNRVASCRSANTLTLNPPYSGVQHANLMIRLAGGDLSAMLTVERGQIVCHPRDCSIGMRVGNGDIVAVDGDEAVGGRSNLVFLSNQKEILRLARAGSPVKFSALFYGDGRETLEFDLSGFDESKIK